MHDTPIQLYILYASATGNCEQISDDFITSLKLQHAKDSKVIIHAKRATMNTFQDIVKKDCLKMCVFMTSSTGDGESPENGLQFQRYLRTEQDPNALSHVSYTVLGLGDSNYSQFQGAPRFLDKKLKQFNAHTFYPRAEADEATSLDKVIEPYLKGLPQAILAEIKRLQNYQPIDLAVRLDSSKQFEPSDIEMSEDVSTSVYTAKVTQKKFVCKTDDKTVIELSLELSRPVKRDRLDVGQSVAVVPKNSEAQVDQVIQQCEWQADLLMGNHSIKEKLTSEIDISSRKLNLQKLVTSFLMLNPDFDDELQLLLLDKQKFTLSELLAFCKPFSDNQMYLTESSIEEGLLKIKPRYYSILNDPYALSESCTELTICFTVHTFKDDFGQQRVGLCTDYLQSLSLGDEVTLNISKNTRVLKLPQFNANTKLVIVCMGTGVVPFISMLKRIQNVGQQCQIQMIYGVRDNHDSCYYKDFLIQFFQLRTNSHLYLACSRNVVEEDNPNVTVTKGYIQDLLSKVVLNGVSEDGVDKDTHILVCGNKNALAKSVFESLQISEQTKEAIKASGQLLMELWNE